MSEIVVYGRANHLCQRCMVTKMWLSKRGIAYRFVNVDEDAEGEAYVRELGALQVPVVVAGEEGLWWTGHRPDRLEELAEMLAVADVC